MARSTYAITYLLVLFDSLQYLYVSKNLLILISEKCIHEA